MTYGDDRYLSSDFKNLQNTIREMTPEGELFGPDFDCWWWNQDPNENLRIDDVDIISGATAIIHVIADGRRLNVSMIKEGDDWKYDDFTDSDDNSYKDMMKSDLERLMENMEEREIDHYE